MSRAPWVLGMMSGTSADGVDAVLLELSAFASLTSEPDVALLPFPRAKVLAHQYTPYPDDLHHWVLAAMQNQADVSGLTQLSFALGQFYADAAAELAKDADLIASHGQTVYHIPRLDETRGWQVRGTLQIGDPAALALCSGRPVISDFRAADMVLGGQGAPLVPFADHVFFAEHGVRRAVHNLGGISNLTYLPELERDQIIAFDTGPANCLIDEAMNKLGKRFDDGGQIAKSGRLEPQLLALWQQDPYLELPLPKSTGREYWTLQKLPSVFELSPKDIVANVTALTANVIADQYQRFVLPHGLDEVLVAGGGVQNVALMQQMTANLPVPVLRLEDSRFGELGFNSATREAAAFALLGYYAYRGWRNTLPHTTGASRAVVAGRLTLGI
jgi:anhydro-N-acetylmuramic acid kinase